MSIYEVIATGTIDLTARSSGATRAPVWALYIVGWAALLPLARGMFLPYFRYIIRGFVFRLTQDGIVVGTASIIDQDVSELILSAKGNSELVSNKMVYNFHPAWTKGGMAALAVRYPELIVLN